jgi:hypothetical protein
LPDVFIITAVHPQIMGDHPRGCNQFAAYYAAITSVIRRKGSGRVLERG